MLNVYVTQPIDFAPFARKSPLSPDRYLLTALSSKDQYYVHFTLMELLRFSHDSRRRKAIFEDISSRPVLIHQLWEHLLLQLGSAHQTLSFRGGLMLSAAPVARARRPPPADSHSIALKSGDIFRPIAQKRSPFSSVMQNVLDSSSPTGAVRTPPQVLAKPIMQAENALKQVEDEAVLKITGARETAVAQAKDVQEKLTGRIEATQIGEKVLGEAKSVLDGIYSWIGREWAVRQADGSLPDTTIICWIIDSEYAFSVKTRKVLLLC